MTSNKWWPHDARPTFGFHLGLFGSALVRLCSVFGCAAGRTNGWIREIMWATLQFGCPMSRPRSRLVEDRCLYYLHECSNVLPSYICTYIDWPGGPYYNAYASELAARLALTGGHGTWAFQSPFPVPFPRFPVLGFPPAIRAAYKVHLGGRTLAHPTQTIAGCSDIFINTKMF